MTLFSIQQANVGHCEELSMGKESVPGAEKARIEMEAYF